MWLDVFDGSVLSRCVQEEGKVTVRLMSAAGRITMPGHIVGIVRNTLGLEAAGIVGRILMLREDDTEGVPLPKISSS